MILPGLALIILMQSSQPTLSTERSRVVSMDFWNSGWYPDGQHPDPEEMQALDITLCESIQESINKKSLPNIMSFDYTERTTAPLPAMDWVKWQPGPPFTLAPNAVSDAKDYKIYADSICIADGRDNCKYSRLTAKSHEGNTYQFGYISGMGKLYNQSIKTAYRWQDNGFIFILNEDGKIVSSEEATRSETESFTFNGVLMTMRWVEEPWKYSNGYIPTSGKRRAASLRIDGFSKSGAAQVCSLKLIPTRSVSHKLGGR